MSKIEANIVSDKSGIEFKDRLGSYCRQMRKDKKISVRVISEATNIHPGAIIKFELGKTDMTISRVYKIIEALEISGEDIKQLLLTQRIKDRHGNL